MRRKNIFTWAVRAGRHSDCAEEIANGTTLHSKAGKPPAFEAWLSAYQRQLEELVRFDEQQLLHFLRRSESRGFEETEAVSLSDMSEKGLGWLMTSQPVP